MSASSWMNPWRLLRRTCRSLLQWHWNRFLGKSRPRGQPWPLQAEAEQKLWVEITIPTTSLIRTHSSYRAERRHTETITARSSSSSPHGSAECCRPEARRMRGLKSRVPETGLRAGYTVQGRARQKARDSASSVHTHERKGCKTVFNKYRRSFVIRKKR